MSDFSLLFPLLALFGGAVAILLLKPRGGDGAQPLPPAITVAASTVAFLGFALSVPAAAVTGVGGFVVRDGLSAGAGALVALCAALTAILMGDPLKKVDANRPEAYALLLFAAGGLTAMATSAHLAAVFIGLEIASLALYALCASVRIRPASTEAGLKYFLAGSFASGMFVMGIALLFGASGRFDLAGVAAGLSAPSGLGAAGATLVLVGFAFKLAVAPFHQWSPDVYEGAPTPITGFMATAVKVAGFATFLRVVMAYGPQPFLHSAMVWLAALTMLVGNLGALAQKSVKRMLAYSGVGHAGYLLLAPISYVPGSTQATEGLVTYLAAYSFTNLLAFGALAYLETREGGGLTFEELRGARWRHPVPVMALIVAVLSLAGAPPTAGFLGKFRVFGAAVDRGLATGDRTYFYLVGLAILTSLVSLGYYLKVIVVTSFGEPEGEQKPLPRFSPAYKAALIAISVVVIWLGVGPKVFGLGAEGLMAFAKRAAG
jgi:NADH-quinone oxidoreductase subunit N